MYTVTLQSRKFWAMLSVAPYFIPPWVSVPGVHRCSCPLLLQSQSSLAQGDTLILHCHRLSLAVHFLGTYTVILLSLPSLSVKMTVVAPG
jgi:hypothetical protein